MIFGVYGRYRHGLVEDYERRSILIYLGEEFLNPEKAAALVPHSETYSETQGPETANSLTAVGFFLERETGFEPATFSLGS
jgi:hypothetical protein